MNPLVSIITPSFNSERYLERFFQGVLAQTYRNIELIFINDGSTDDTERLAGLFGNELLKQGMHFVYIRQENAGASAAMNRGLGIFTGDYLTWVDSDDIMHPDNISQKIDYLQRHPEYGFAMSGIQFVDENAPEKIIRYSIRKKPEGEDRLFEDYILGRNVVWGPGTVLVRRECILRAFPERKIYVSREGQNWQMMLPLSWLYRCGYIEEALLTCVQHEDSHSRVKRTAGEQIQREKNFITLCSESVNHIPGMGEDEKKHWLAEIQKRHNRKIMQIAFENRDYHQYSDARKTIRQLGGKTDLGEAYWIVRAQMVCGNTKHIVKGAIMHIKAMSKGISKE